MLYHPLYNEKDNDNIAYNRSNSDSFCDCVSSYRNFTTRACSDKQDKCRSYKCYHISLQNSSNIAGPSSTNTSAANNTGAYNASSQNKTGNPLSNLPVIGKFFK